MNDRLNILVPALTFGLQVENRKSVRKAFSSSVRLPEDVKDESKDLRDMQQLLTSLGKYMHELFCESISSFLKAGNVLVSANEKN